MRAARLPRRRGDGLVTALGTVAIAAMAVVAVGRLGWNAMASALALTGGLALVLVGTRAVYAARDGIEERTETATRRAQVGPGR